MIYYIGAASGWENYDHAISADKFDMTIGEGKAVCGRKANGLQRGYGSGQFYAMAHTLEWQQKWGFKLYQIETVMCSTCEKILLKAGE